MELVLGPWFRTAGLYSRMIAANNLNQKIRLDFGHDPNFDFAQYCLDAPQFIPTGGLSSADIGIGAVINR